MPMKKLAVMAASVLLVVSCQDATNVVAPDMNPDASTSFELAQTPPNRIILLDPAIAPGEAEENRSRAAAIAAQLGITPTHSYGAAVFGFSGPVSDGRIQALQQDPRVVKVETVEAWELAQQSVPTGEDRIEVDKNPSADVDGSDDARVDMDIAIIDTGISDHVDLNIGQRVSFAGGDGTDGNGHGTHVAGTAAALDNDRGVVGAAPGARVHGAKVCKNGGICLTSDIVAGIDWATGRKAEANDGDGDGDPGINFASANMSIGTSDEDFTCDAGDPGAVHQAICGAVNAGIVFVIAGGNDGRLKDAYPEAFAVSAIADFDGLGGGKASPTCRTDGDDTRANFSNWGASMDVAAPGVCIRSTWNDGGYNTISGTSMAAPHAAGAVALYLHANSLAPATDAAGVGGIEQAIRDAAIPQSDVCGYSNDSADQSTEGLLFANAAAFGGDGSCEVAGATTDIAVSAVSAPSSVVQGDVVSVDVTIENTGTEDVTSDISVTLTDDTDAVTIGTQTISGGLSAGASTTVTYSWDTSSASLGDHTLTARHDFTDDEPGNDSKSIVVKVTEQSTASHVGDLDGNSINNGPTWTAEVTIEVHDGSHGTVSGATVTGTWSAPVSSNVSCITDTNGRCTVSAGGIHKSNASVSFKVTDIVSDLTYDSSLNHDPDGDSNGTTITVSKP